MSMTRLARGSRIGILLTACALMGSASFAASPGGGLRYSVFVEKFEDKSGSHTPLGGDWETQLTSALQESGRFIVVAQTDMQHSALKEQSRGTSGVTAQGRKTAARSRMTPAQLLVKGVITYFKQGGASQDSGVTIHNFKFGGGRAKTEIRATLQMVDATTGTLVASKSFTGIAQRRAFSFGAQGSEGEGNIKAGEDDNINAAFEKAIADVIPWMTAQLNSVPWRGSVVKIDGEHIIINRGSREGVADGEDFITGESEIVTDPDTGETLDEVLHERARIRVVRVNERTSTCSVISGNTNQIITGMAIQPGREKG
jgi:curli biogenesis system outer membrane secretion channel CsgG